MTAKKSTLITNKAESVSDTPQKPETPRFEVIREYSGISIGTIVKTSNPAEINYMIEQGYWRQV